jgi:Leucine-rich repeat (LRR) protein
MTWRIIGARPSVVVNVDLQTRGLTGDVPAELGRLTALRGLYLHGNQLTSVPAELGNLLALEAGAYTRSLE